MNPSNPDHLFGPQIARSASVGAVAGVVIVLVLSVALIGLTGQSSDLMAVGVFAAGFGGAGFGAMMGGVLAAIRVHADEVADRPVTAR